VPPPDPPDLRDPELDAWWLSVQDRAFLSSATHGDYYRRNLLCAKRRIVGVIDWHDASVQPLAVELSGATFEMCRDDEHLLQLDRANDFVASYRVAGGPVPERELDMLLPLIRLWVRNDARGSLAHIGHTDDGYAARQMRAFRALASCEWRPGSVTDG
jgi:aminoglycoside phosphotransferase (APT) family kinase protein